MVDLFVLANGYIIISTNFRTWTGIHPSCITKLILDFPNVKPWIGKLLVSTQKIV